ncbi:zinc ABC transporter substrate-binding protein [Galbitalea sp. SE-J8]|uniref:metal ABC transporter solute-binding protein, Zn/Mn family n=1 Tax=Galbitalea sp. SE-J8 TaxID=3054952 RepID=UPI00259C85AD|nr:zinc ABC transporter substrate-binding protein [Galbitalea sp. SE-J8]MDM4762419.1 zinc ABC transporter substrate-binding protein [Galbitalea sp. SE-J8]
MTLRPLAVLASGLTLAVVLAGCSGSPTPSSSGTGGGGSTPIAVVASTNVYGDIAGTIGGDLVDVTSIIDDPDKDPHEYEADAQNQLALSKAQVVIENGGGYDDFVDTLLSSAGNTTATVLNAADISGYDQEPADGEFNEHVWYDFPTVSKVVDQLVDALSSIDSADAATFQKNGADLQGKLTDLEGQEADLKTKYAGEGVAITEPVPLYLLDAIGLDNKTPAEFSEAIEEDTDVPADVLKQTTDLFSTGQVALLAYNAQTTGPQTEAVLTAAKDNDVPVVPVTETLPAGTSYIEWMQHNLDAVSAALGS